MPGLDGAVLTGVTLQLSRDQILDATERCLREAGYDGTTIRRIAGELDCAVGSIYRYFRDKRDLLYAVTQRMLEPALRLAEGKASLAESEQAYLVCAGQSPLMYRLMFWVACVEVDAGGAGAARLPGVIEQIIAAWSRKLGDAAEARRRWVALHGQLLLGGAEAPVTEPAAQQRELRALARPVMDRQAVIADLPPLPARPSSDHAPVELVAEAAGHSEDVCLL